MSKQDNYESEEKEIDRLGDKWFNFKNDIDPREFDGCSSKDYLYRLGYQDQFVVTVYYKERKQVGASMLYTPTMTRKFTKTQIWLLELRTKLKLELGCLTKCLNDSDLEFIICR
jgi:hypothetical protein